MGAYVQEVRQDDNAQNLLFKIGRFLAAATTGYSSLSVSTSSKQTANPPSTAAISTSAGTVFTLAAGEVGFIQNLDTDTLFVRREAGASTTQFHYALRGGTAPDDGIGGTVTISDHIGPVSVAGSTPRFIAWKILVS